MRSFCAINTSAVFCRKSRMHTLTTCKSSKAAKNRARKPIRVICSLKGPTTSCWKTKFQNWRFRLKTKTYRCKSCALKSREWELYFYSNHQASTLVLPPPKRSWAPPISQASQSIWIWPIPAKMKEKSTMKAFTDSKRRFSTFVCEKRRSCTWYTYCRVRATLWTKFSSNRWNKSTLCDSMSFCSRERKSWGRKMNLILFANFRSIATTALSHCVTGPFWDQECQILCRCWTLMWSRTTFPAVMKHLHKVATDCTYLQRKL
jgi:hypothetical protein